MGEAAKREYENRGGGVIRLKPPASKRGSGVEGEPDVDRAAPNAPQSARQTGTDLVPYEDVERFGFQHLRQRGGRAPGLVYWPLKLVRTVLLLIACLAFAGGLYDTVSWSAHKVIGRPLVGVVTALEPAAAGLSKPTVDYVLPLDGGEWRVESRLPRGDLKVGDKIAISVIPGSEGLTRIQRSEFWRTVAIAALVGGAAMIWLLATFWPRVETLLGWRRQQEGAAATHTRTIAALMITITLVGVGWMKFVYTPWLGVSELTQLITAPDKAMRTAGRRCGLSGEGPLNACELTVMGASAVAAEGAYRAALRDNDFESLARYHAAIANPEIPFDIDWASTTQLLLESEPEVLIGLLSTGAVPPPEVAGDLLAGAEARGWSDVSAAIQKAVQPGG